jgi:UDP-glucose 4-epimerase
MFLFAARSGYTCHMSEKRKLILVTGGAGFIGSHLCERLVGEGHKVISLDNYFTGSTDNHVPGVEYREGHTKNIAKHVPEKPDIIYHLGEYSRVEQSVFEPDVVEDLNIVGTMGVVEYWKSKKSKLIYAGSSTKFGDGGTARHTSPYARTKAENSETVARTGEREKLPYAITYFYNVYGDRERSGVYGTVIEHFKRMYLSGAPCAVVSPGTQERNFTHVDDIVDALVLIGEKGEGDEYGIGNERAYSILDVAKMFQFSDIVMFPERTGNRMSSFLDSSKTRLLGWMPKRELSEYIREFIESHPRGIRKDRHVIVFATTMHPAGLAERALIELAKNLPTVFFTVVASRHSRSTPRFFEILPNLSVRTVGVGKSFDKYFLPILGAVEAYRETRRKQPLFAWSILASYPTFAGILFRRARSVPLLVTLGDQSVDDLSFPKRIALRAAITRSDQVYGTHGAQEAEFSQAARQKLPKNSIGDGDAFANAIRFAYADIIRRELQK